MARPDARLVPILLDRRSQGRESLLLGLVRALLLIFTGGATASTVAQANAVTRTALSSEVLMTWAALDQLSGEMSAKPADLLDEVLAQEPWALRHVEQVVRDMQAEVDAATAEVEAEVRAMLADAAAVATQAHGDVSEGSEDPVIGYRRVPHPELAKSGTCGLCFIASTRMYRRGDLRKIHSGCHCEVVEVRASHDPGGDLNNLELGDIYRAANLSRGDYGNRSALSNIRIERRDGELVITRRRNASTPTAPNEPIEISAANQQAVADLFASIASAYGAAS